MMTIVLTFPDGATKTVARDTTPGAVAAALSKSLAKSAVAARVNGALWDLGRPIKSDATLEILTKDAPDALEVLRHDAAHVMAEAVQELFPGTQVTIGPAIENGFYYDFYREEPFTLDDLPKIEQRMREIVSRNEDIVREVWSRDEAIALFRSMGEAFKVEIVQDLPEDAEITLYRQGNFIDLCRGPHLPNTAKLGTAFKLTRLAGAYWRGDATKPQLQRIYGTAWATEEQLKNYLKMLEEAEKRDHRRLGREMGLFHFQEEAPGSIFWHPKGWKLYQTLQHYLRRKMSKAGYEEVSTPLLLDRTFWEKSGHWDKFGAKNMFCCESEARTFAVKPMNCPGHVQIFKQGIKSYRDLPLRLAEFNTLHRNEPSGSLHGMLRVRAFHQDDAHIFCREEQINSEALAFCELLKTVYKDLGFTDIHVKFSDRPATRAGDDADWDKAEAALKEAALAAGLNFTLNPGEGAFYGPKLEFALRDALGRDWQCGTIQCDFVLPKRLGATYVAEDGSKQHPVMLHRAIVGSLERFLGILIEHTAGHLPLWLSPVPVVVATITDEAKAYAEELAAVLRDHDIGVVVDSRNEKINYKVREHSLTKTPFIWAVGKNEVAQQTVAVRRLGAEGQQVLTRAEAIAQLQTVTAIP